MAACRPTTYGVPEYDNLGLAEVEGVSTVMDPLYPERLVLKANSVRLRLLLFVHRLREHEEAQEGRTVLHRKRNEIVDACEDCPVIHSKCAPHIA